MNVVNRLHSTIVSRILQSEAASCTTDSVLVMWGCTRQTGVCSIRLHDSFIHVQ